MDAVDQLLQTWRRTGFEWGQSDCLLSVGDYIASRGGLDVAGGFRGTYTTESEAMTLMRDAGGAEGLIDRTGLERGVSPERGDVVVIDASGDGDGIAAICTGPGIAARLERGVVEVNKRLVTVLHVWKVPQ